MQDPLKGTHHEFMSTKMASASKLEKGKAVKHSVTGLRNHTSKAFQEKYQDSFQVIRLLGKNRLEVKDQKGHLRQIHITDVKKTTMPGVIANAVPDYTQFGRATKLRFKPKQGGGSPMDNPWRIHNSRNTSF